MHDGDLTIETWLECPSCRYRFIDEDSARLVKVGLRAQVEVDCPGCKRKFLAEAHYMLYYFTSKDCKVNGEAHDLQPYTICRDPGTEKCSKCGRLLYGWEKRAIEAKKQKEEAGNGSGKN